MTSYVNSRGPKGRRRESARRKNRVVGLVVEGGDSAEGSTRIRCGFFSPMFNARSAAPGPRQVHMRVEVVIASPDIFTAANSGWLGRIVISSGVGRVWMSYKGNALHDITDRGINVWFVRQSGGHLTKERGVNRFGSPHPDRLLRKGDAANRVSRLTEKCSYGPTFKEISKSYPQFEKREEWRKGTVQVQFNRLNEYLEESLSKGWRY